MPVTRLGWKPSPYDGRDYFFSRTQRAADARRLTLDHPFPVRNQQDVPCCVSCAVAVCMEILDARNSPQIELSALYHYYVTRPNQQQMIDLTIREGLGSAATRGLCARSFYDPPFTRLGIA